MILQELTNQTTGAAVAVNSSVDSNLVATDSASDGQFLTSLLAATKMLFEHSVLFGEPSDHEFTCSLG